MERKIVKLRHPITVGTETTQELSFRPIKGKDMRRIKTPAAQSLAMTLELAGYLSGQPTHVIDELQGDDLTEVMQVVTGFLGGSPATGDE